MKYQAVLMPTKILGTNYATGKPIFRDGKPVLLISTTTETSQEVEVFYNLTDPRGNLLGKYTNQLDDGHYKLILWRESFGGRLAGKERYAFHSWHLIKKMKDYILWENKYPVVGHMFNEHLTQPRDVQEEVRRVNWDYIPGTTERFKAHKDIDSKTNRIYSYGN